jgi:hypothetical protein
MGETLPGAAQGDGARAWQGRLPLTGTYQIVVSPALGPAAYVLRLEQRGKRPLGGLRGPRRSARPEDHAKAIGQADKESQQQRRRSLGADDSRQAAFEARTPAAENRPAARTTTQPPRRKSIRVKIHAARSCS